MLQRLLISLLLVCDTFVFMLSIILALLLRFDGTVEPKYFDALRRFMPLVLLIGLGNFYIFRMYRRLWQYASLHELLSIVKAVTVSSLLVFIAGQLLEVHLPKSIYLISWFFNLVFVGASRLVLRLYYYFRSQNTKVSQNILIIGAGDAGAIIAREILHRYYDTKKIIGFLDDDPDKRNRMLYGVKVIGAICDLSEIVSKNEVSEIIIAMPSVHKAKLREIVNQCQGVNCKVKIIPGVYEMIDGKVTFQQLRNVDLEDLLGRQSVQLDLQAIANYLQGKRVLVTGAGGSIGSELCRQIARMSPSILILLGKGENSIYEIDRELRMKYPKLAIEPVIADVRDKQRIDEIFQFYRPEAVFHAAAHKHVPLMERQPVEAVKNNIFGTKTVAEVAKHYKTETFIMISTDKAVNPTSVMGATKRVAELIVQSLNGTGTTKFAAVRFGNVLGSRGSVIPLFKKQIASGGPITVTHPDMKRYFMTIPEASQLVLQAGALAKGGEVFVLDMGEPVMIVDMAKDLIRLSGLEPEKDIAIQFTGLRPGEKLFEELLTAEEGTTATKCEKIYQANLRQVDRRKLEKVLIQLQSLEQSNEIIDLLGEVIPSYKMGRTKAVVANGNIELLKIKESDTKILPAKAMS